LGGGAKFLFGGLKPPKPMPGYVPALQTNKTYRKQHQRQHISRHKCNKNECTDGYNVNTVLKILFEEKLTKYIIAKLITVASIG
jgi:hypothetical protein